ncbi:MAG TPA: hypothetical protein VKA45_04070 [Gaiellaceae bacterium]|nr:hypothetical protein [Gaiellaceae bacterium]
MRLALVLVAVALLLAGCGESTDPKKQAEDLGSVAAEGALLAHDAADGASTGPFTRVHSEVLREDVHKLEAKLKQRPLVRLADEISSALDELPDQPDAAARRLDDAADRADELAQ